MRLITLAAIIFGFASQAFAWQFGFSAGYSPNYLVNIENSGTISGTSSSSSQEWTFAGTPEFGVAFWHNPKNSWGFISGFQYGGERELKSVKVNGTTMSVSQAPPKFQTHFAYVGTAYRWDSFFIPLGLSYAFTKYIPSPNDTVDFTVNSSMGALIGLGWFLGDHFVLQLIGRSAVIETKTTSPTTNQSGTGMIGSAIFEMKYFF